MTQAEAAREVREVLSGQAGGVNRVLRRFGKPIVDYATALIPDRAAPFDRLVEDILVDVISQIRACARASGDEQVFEFVVEAAMRTVRSRYPDVLAGQAKPDKATRSYNFKEVIERTRMTEAEITAGISEGRISAKRENDQLKIRGDNIPGLGDRRAFMAYNVTAADRELLVLHYCLGFTPEVIGRWLGISASAVEDLMAKASNKLASGLARRGTPVRESGKQDTEMRRYIDGRMGSDETSKFEKGMVKDKIAQQRLDELRTQSGSLKELFTSSPYDLSSIAVNVRARNPHHALSLPPAAALWLQVVCLVALMLMFHSVGAYLAPPTVTVRVVEGAMELPGDSRMIVGSELETPAGAQAMLEIDQSSRLLLAPHTGVKLLEPRKEARQVLGVHKGEVWGRFTSGGHAFLIEFPAAHGALFDIRGEDGAEFDLVVGPTASSALPDNLDRERVRALAAMFEPQNGGLLAPAVSVAADFRFGSGDDGLRAGDIVESIGGVSISSRDELAEALARVQPGENIQLTIHRDNVRIAVPVTRVETMPVAVLRVFHGAVTCGSGGAERTLVNTSQWAVFSVGQPPLVGLRGMEDYRLLRISEDERFKDRLHWLHTEHFPLRAENSVLAVDRALRRLAERLETMRKDEIVRDGSREIAMFETTMREAIEDAKDRLQRGEGRERGDTSASMSDAALVKSEDDILGVIEHWKRQAGTGVYPTLGSAAKTLVGPISRDRDELETRGEEIARSITMQDRIGKLDEALDLKDADIAKLEESEFFDGDGSVRKSIDDAIALLQKDVKAANDAKGRIELLTIKLNDLDQRIDAQKRKLPGLRKSVDEAQAALNAVDKALTANIYTADKLKAAETAKSDADTALAAATTKLETLKDELADALKAQSDATTSRDNARKPLPDLQKAATDAEEVFTDAVTSRTRANAAFETADADYVRIKAELDAMPADDPGRPAKEAELATAEKAQKQAREDLDAAITAADAANTALDTANSNLSRAQKLADDTQTTLDSAAAVVKDSQTRHDAQVRTKQTAETNAKNADATLKAQQDAKTARALLDQQRVDADSGLTTAKANLKTVEDAAAALETEAQPERDKLTAELALVDAGEVAKAGIETKKTERDRYQAVSDAIALHEKDRKVLQDERDGLANSKLVLGYAQLTLEYEDLSRRIDAHEMVRARAMLEDANFAFEQQAARDRFKEAADDSARQAVETLLPLCPAYAAGDDKEGLPRELAAKIAETRPAVMEALWKLYYDAGIDASDDGEGICYYVAIQSGAGVAALEKLDSRWKAYLTQAFGAQEFEKLAALKRENLEN